MQNQADLVNEELIEEILDRVDNDQDCQRVIRTQKNGEIQFFVREKRLNNNRRVFVQKTKTPEKYSFSRCKLIQEEQKGMNDEAIENLKLLIENCLLRRKEKFEYGNIIIHYVLHDDFENNSEAMDVNITFINEKHYSHA